MRQGYERAVPIRRNATQNLVLRAGFCLALVFNAVEASPSPSTAGMTGASVSAVLVKPVAVNISSGFLTGSNDNSSAGGQAEGEAVPLASRGEDMPQFHLQGIAAVTRFHLGGTYDRDDAREARHVSDTILAHLRDDAPQTARHVLESSAADCLQGEDFTALRTRIAAGFLYAGKNEQALELAQRSIAEKSDEALWIAGLAAYRLEQDETAARYFKAVANANPDAWTTGAAAFWAARATTRMGDEPGARRWLILAAARKDTFYGMLAQRMLDDAGHVERPAVAAHLIAYTVPRWKPRDGFVVDPALIYAIMRQESKFDPQAESDVGAIGLMQIMPRTAAQVTQRHTNWETALLDPQTNLDIGQRYVRTLLQSDNVANNLIMIAIAYNGGPTALGRRRHDNDESDPLLFLETVPAGETRGFIEQVLTNYWNYRARLREDTASLSDLAAGKWPMYTEPRSKPTLVADAR